MNLSVVLEHRFAATPDGAVWTQAVFGYPFWQRYLEVFDAVRVVARLLDVPEVPGDWKRADGENVRFARVPHYIGPEQFVRRAGYVVRAVRQAVGPQDAVILRVPSLLANILTPVLLRRGQPFGLEVVGDPYDVFAPRAFRHPLRPLLRWWFTRSLKRQCALASAVAYVTQYALQRRYPPLGRSFSFSSVELLDSAYALSSRSFDGEGVTLITVGSLAQMYKGADVLLDAVALCLRQGLDLDLIIVGDGKHRRELENRAARLGLHGRVQFVGQLAREEVLVRLDQADLFVLVSRVEGLPRAMLEAMARGLPCIGSTVGGIPELLPPEDMVPPNDAKALAAKIREVLSDPERMRRMSERNLRKAQEYREEILQQRRAAFYRYLREETEEWLKKNR